MKLNMKIAIIVRNVRARDGGTRVALSAAREYVRMGHDVKIYTVKFDREKTYTELIEGIPIVSLNDLKTKPKPLFGINLPGFSILGSYFTDHKFAKVIAKKIDSDTDFLNAQSSRISYLTGHYFKKNVRNVPLVWQMNDLGLLLWTHCVANLRNPDSKCSFFQKTFYEMLDYIDTHLFLKSVDYISVLNNETKRDAKKYLNRDSVVIRAGVDSNFFKFYDHKPPQNKLVRIISFAQLTPHRRFEDGIEAVKLMVDEGYDISYVIIGDCETYRAYRDYKARLASLALDLGVSERVFFAGRSSPEAVIRYFNEADIFVHTNHLQTWGLAVFEAMSAGLPVVLSKGAGAHEVVKDGVEAILAEPKNPRSLVEGIKILADDPVLYKDVCRNGGKFVREKITWRSYAEGVLLLINSGSL